jgi:hypothetical protein
VLRAVYGAALFLFGRATCLFRGHRWWFERYESIPNPDRWAAFVFPTLCAPRHACLRCGAVGHDSRYKPINNDARFAALLAGLERAEGRAPPTRLRLLDGGQP